MKGLVPRYPVTMYIGIPSPVPIQLLILCVRLRAFLRARVFACPGNASNLCDLADNKGGMNPLDEARLSLVAWQCLDECNQRLKGGDHFDGCCVSLCEYIVLPSPLNFNIILFNFRCATTC